MNDAQARKPEIDRKATEAAFDTMMAAAPLPALPDLQQMQEDENAAVKAAYDRYAAAAGIPADQFAPPWL